MDHVTRILRVFAACVAAAFAAFVAWYAAYAVMWLLMWLVAALAALAAAWLVGNYVNGKLGTSVLGSFGATGVTASVRTSYDSVLARFFNNAEAAVE